MLKALVSIHDVMPSTRTHIDDQLQALHQAAEALTPDKVTLLVVPGKDWQPSDVAWLQQLANQGYVLAGHGWFHQAREQRNFYHHLHSLLLSRNAAEHLSQNRDELNALVHRCYSWFQQHDLPLPELYVPPAWAVGRFHPDDWGPSPFSVMETLNGVVDLNTKAFRPMPLCGFEADTLLRMMFLYPFNQWNMLRAKQSGRALRIGMHPYDLDGYLRQQVFSILSQVSVFEDY